MAYNKYLRKFDIYNEFKLNKVFNYNFGKRNYIYIIQNKILKKPKNHPMNQFHWMTKFLTKKALSYFTNTTPFFTA